MGPRSFSSSFRPRSIRWPGVGGGDDCFFGGGGTGYNPPKNTVLSCVEYGCQCQEARITQQ